MLTTKQVVTGWINGLYTDKEAMDFIADMKVNKAIEAPTMDWLNGKMTAEGALREIVKNVGA